MDNPRVFVKKTKNHGNGVFSSGFIRKNEIIAEFDGKILGYYSKSWDHEKHRNHAIQFEKGKWRDSNGIARKINHSCEPNCGIKNLFQVVAMRNIKKGEEITWDYEMTEDSDWWRMKCTCDTPSCRKIIGAYSNLPKLIRKRYKGYISTWLLKNN